MSTTTSAVATGIVVMAGRWSQGKGVDLRVAIGATVYAVALSLISSGNEKLARQFAVLVLVAALMKYTIPIVHGLDVVDSATKGNLGKAKRA